MLKTIIEHLAKKYYDVRIENDFSGNADGDYRGAERDIQKVLAGEIELFTLKWALSEMDYAWLESEIKLIHGKCYALNHDVIHFCEKVNAELDQGNIRSAQDILEKFCEQARIELLQETNHGQ